MSDVEDLPTDPDVFARAIGLRVTELRERAGLSRRAFAAALSKGRTYAGRLELGQNMTVATLLLICRVLGARPAELFEPPTSTPSAKRGRGRPRKVVGEGAGASRPLRVAEPVVVVRGMGRKGKRGD